MTNGTVSSTIDSEYHPDELPDDEPYGCVNRQISSPRECVESGHYWCDAFKSKPPRGEP
jgi:hypothetical protein